MRTKDTVITVSFLFPFPLYSTHHSSALNNSLVNTFSVLKLPGSNLAYYPFYVVTSKWKQNGGGSYPKQ